MTQNLPLIPFVFKLSAYSLALSTILLLKSLQSIRMLASFAVTPNGRSCWKLLDGKSLWGVELSTPRPFCNLEDCSLILAVLSPLNGQALETLSIATLPTVQISGSWWPLKSHYDTKVHLYFVRDTKNIFKILKIVSRGSDAYSLFFILLTHVWN